MSLRLLNLGCGAVREKSEVWTNLDLLHPVLPVGSPERAQLDSEKNYVEHDLNGHEELPFPENEFDGILLAHTLEHFSAREGVFLMKKCRRVLKPGGILVVSVPDAAYFRQVYEEDNAENCVRLFGEPLREGVSFFRTALWFYQHEAIFTEDVLWSYFKRTDFQYVVRIDPSENCTDMIFHEMGFIHPLLNRRKFSLVLCGVKGDKA